MRTLIWMARGKADGELDLYYAITDDAWERTARQLTMIHHLIVTVSNMFGGKLKFEKTDHFNDSLRAPEDSPEAIEDDYPWAEPEDAKAIEGGQGGHPPAGGPEVSGTAAPAGGEAAQAVCES